MIPNLVQKFDQIVIYGPKGWIGRSAVELALRSGFDQANGSLLLIGREPEFVEFDNKNLEILNLISGLKYVKQNSLFVNCAFLRREVEAQIGVPDFYDKNLIIMNGSKEILNTEKIKVTINLSSGIAGHFQHNILIESSDCYGFLKYLDESWLEDLCDDRRVKLVNCRVFSISGKNLNNFSNLALGSFIEQARSSRKIEVRAPHSMRTYVDSDDLMQVLFRLALEDQDVSVDSGGVLTDMFETATQIATRFTGTQIFTGKENPNFYYGDYETFNSLAKEQGVTIKGLSQQIDTTLKGIRI
jgi:nucleoside-diphosphate-sugar epimerase